MFEPFIETENIGEEASGVRRGKEKWVQSMALVGYLGEDAQKEFGYTWNILCIWCLLNDGIWKRI